MLDALQRVLLRVADVALGARISVVVEAEDVRQPAMSGDADHRGQRPLAFFGMSR